MDTEKYVTYDVWFAWRPILTHSGKIKWLTKVKRKIDEREEVYLGLLPTTTYYEL